MNIEWIRNKDIMVANDLVSKRDSKRIMDFIKSRTEWKPASVYDNGQEAIRDTRTCHNIYITKELSAGNEDFRLLDDEINKIIFTGIAEYTKAHPALPIRGDEGYEVNRYEPGQEFKPHIDFARNLSYTRQVSACLYLNDDYEGGELNFPTLDIKIKPKLGSLILFPSNYIYVHQSSPVLSGVKYSIVTWFN